MVIRKQESEKSENPSRFSDSFTVITGIEMHRVTKNDRYFLDFSVPK